MARPKIVLNKGMLLGENQLEFVREIEGKKYPSGVYERWVEVICPTCGEIFQTSLNRITRKSGSTKNPVKQCPECAKKENNKRIANLGKAMITDLTGQTFGNLTVLNITNQRKNGYNVVWHCKCTCGNECDVNALDLKRGHTTSCGCIKSKGETKLINLFIANNILFESQYYFNDCINPDTGAYLRFDFYLPEYQCLVEYDGEQHYNYTNQGWNDKEHFEANQKRDQIKNEYCQNKNIKLIRIPYWDYDKLNKEYLFDKLKNL